MAQRDYRSGLRAIAQAAQAAFTETHEVREQALRLSRLMVRNSANSIRATHRGEFDQARELLTEIAEMARQTDELLGGYPGIYHAGYVEDALKEYAEASATLAFAEGSVLLGPAELGMGAAPYLNGLAEAVGELRRFILDSLRRDDIGRCEELLGVMDEIYTILVSMDFPDAVTRGLRRSTDMARGILERTRGDLTLALSQRRLDQRLAAFQRRLENAADGSDPDPD
jgi:translin